MSEISLDLINRFDCGNFVFNAFLKEKAKKWQTSGKTVTYILTSEQKDRVYAYASIAASGITNQIDDKISIISCAEIKMFAISRCIRGVDFDGCRKYSDIAFNLLIQDLYSMSCSTIGFQAIILYANSEGKSLYERNGFCIFSDYYVAPNIEEDLDITECVPLICRITDDVIYNIFKY